MSKRWQLASWCRTWWPFVRRWLLFWVRWEASEQKSYRVWFTFSDYHSGLYIKIHLVKFFIFQLPEITFKSLNDTISTPIPEPDWMQQKANQRGCLPRCFLAVSVALGGWLSALSTVWIVAVQGKHSGGSTSDRAGPISTTAGRTLVGAFQA